MADDPRIDQLCEAVGIALSFQDAMGAEQTASAAGKRRVLEALGVRVETDSDIAEHLARVSEQQRRPLPELLIVEAGARATEALASPKSAEWTLRLEDGESLSGKSDGSGHLALPALPAGYHRLNVLVDKVQTESTVLAAPPSCYMPAALADGGRAWGVTAQVYSLRGPKDVGVGTYADVEALAKVVGERGGAFLGLSPLHALFATDPTKYSPYSPSSRLFLNTGLIALADVPGFRPEHASDGVDDQASLIDYSLVLPRQRHALDAIWRDQRESAARDIAEFRQAGGERLELHATFDALSDHFAAQGSGWIGHWPSPLRDAHSPEVAAFRRKHVEEITFHIWLQWLADAQLAKASAAARAQRMSVGLYRDLAVGADRGGSEVWSAPERFVTGLSVGAPPDLLGPKGQDWGLPPFHPLTLASSGLAAFRDLVAANMRHAGALRIDHAFQLQRLFVLPQGGAAKDGVYLNYPLDALLASLRIESHRAKCLVIGEDLGTSPAGFSDAIMAAGMLSYRLLPFERGKNGSFNAPAAYPSRALAALSTHDLPTFAGWWLGADTDARECVGVFHPAQAREERNKRPDERAQLLAAFAADGIPAGSAASERPPLAAAVRYLARTPCALAAVQLEDILGEAQQANLPGPEVGHPNWRRRYSIAVDRVSTHPGLDRVASVFATEGRSTVGTMSSTVPGATYRLQLHAKFTFDDAAAVVPYLARLGVTHVYTSPIQMAKPGSTHGYDVVDPSRINPELGGLSAFRRFSDTVLSHGLKLLVDIVPNHVGVGGSENPWWLDVLEWGRRSVHASTFDIDWEKPGADGKLIVPFLGEPLADLLTNGGVKLRFEPKFGRFAVWYADHCHPVSPLDYAPLLADVPNAAPSAKQFDALAAAATDGALPDTLHARAAALQRQLADFCAADSALAKALEVLAEKIGGDQLRVLIDRQNWRLVHWTDANEKINYRRFFDITSLAGIRVEDPRVFEAAHRVIFEQIEDGRIHGLRLDHIDGLADPAAYLKRLNSRVGPGFYTVVEKILEPDEHLPSWPLDGTTGYDALHTLDAVFFDEAALPTLDAIHAELPDSTRDRRKALFDIKTELAERTFISEFEGLAADLAPSIREAGDFRPALRALLSAFPVYRTYGEGDGFSEQDHAALNEARRVAAAALSAAERPLLDAVVNALANARRTGADMPRALRRFQQLTGPLMAKSFEDTLFYRDARFIAANEVGCGPEQPGIDTAEFHRANIERATDWPGSLLATATHDTKRGEDARGRLLVATGDMKGWTHAWTVFKNVPEAADLALENVYFLFQALIAATPLSPAEGISTDFTARASAFTEKSLREGKVHSNWTAPDEQYEAAAKALVAAAASTNGVLFRELASFIQKIARAGARLGIARTILKCTVPGVPDTYQGSELADLSFVDPDNRRPVDYASRLAALDRAFDPTNDDDLIAGYGKLFALRTLLADRREFPATYRGAYVPLSTSDPHRSLAFSRGDGDAMLIVIARRDMFAMPADWSLRLEQGTWRNLFDGRTFSGELDLNGDELLGEWPAIALRRCA